MKKRLPALGLAGLSLAAGLTLPLTLHAAPAAPRPQPLDADAPVPPLQYRSTLQTYRPLPELQPQSWRESNDRVGRIGGWRAYAREAHQPENTPAAAAAPASATHDSHKH